MYTNYVEMSEGMGSTGSTTYDCHYKNMASWVRTTKLVSCWGYNAHTLFSKSTKVIFRVQ